MLSAIDAPKSKSISIAFISLKSMILGLVFTNTFKKLNKQHDCSDLTSQISVIQLFFILGLVLDILALSYFYFTDKFSRLQYYVFYTFHIILAIFLTASILGKVNEQYTCEIANEYLGSVIILCLVFMVSSFILMWANLYFGLKYAHLGSNIVWTFMFFGESNGCGQVLIAIIASIHGVISVIGLITFVVLKILRKTTCTAKCWKYIISISIICMLFCYLLCILELLVPLKCQKASYFINSYKIYGLIELVSPILLLIFLKTEVGDPRDHIVKKKEEVFAKWRENPNITDEQT